MPGCSDGDQDEKQRSENGHNMRPLRKVFLTLAVSCLEKKKKKSFKYARHVYKAVLGQVPTLARNEAQADVKQVLL